MTPPPTPSAEPASPASVVAAALLDELVRRGVADLVLSPGAETEPGVFACDVKYVPVSGHRKDSESVARMVKSGPSLLIFEAAPGLWAPHRVGMPTSVGTLAITRAAPQDAD